MLMTTIIETLINQYGVPATQLKGSRPKINCINPDHDDSTPSMEIHPERGVFYCHGCGCKGNVTDLINRKFKFKTNSITEKHVLCDEAREYLNSRGASDDVINSSKIYSFRGSENDPYNRLQSMYPQYTNELFIAFEYNSGSIKYRNLDTISDPKNDKFRCYKSQSVFYNIGFMVFNKDHRNNHYYFVEGEMDALVLASKGYKNVCSCSGSNIRSDDILRIAPADGLYGVNLHFWFDNDEAGRDCTTKLLSEFTDRKDIPVCILYVADLQDFKDPAEAFSNSSFLAKENGVHKHLVLGYMKSNPSNWRDKEIFENFMNQQTGRASPNQKQLMKKLLCSNFEKLKSEHFQYTVQSWEELDAEFGDEDDEETADPIIFKTGFSYIDKNFEFVAGRLLLLSGESGYGKTSFCINMLANQHDHNASKPCFISLEMSKKDIHHKFKLLKKKKNLGTFNTNHHICDLSNQSVAPQDLISIIKDMSNDYKVMFIDHASLINYNNTDSVNIYLAQAEFMRELHTVILDKQICVILLMQQTKASKKGTVGEAFKGASEFKEVCDAMIQIDPPTDQKGNPLPEDNSTKVLKFYKNRYGRSGDKGCKIQFDGIEFSEFQELDDGFEHMDMGP